MKIGALVHLVLQGPDGRAAIGRLCNLYGRHHGMGDAIVKLTMPAIRDAEGYPIKVPELSLVGWEDWFHASEWTTTSRFRERASF